MNPILKKKSTRLTMIIVGLQILPGQHSGDVSVSTQKNWWVLSRETFNKSSLYSNKNTISQSLIYHSDLKKLYIKNTSVTSIVAYTDMQIVQNPKILY